MKIIRSRKYLTSLRDILKFIALDSKQRAINFKDELDLHIKNLTIFPYKFRKSIYFDDENIRDLIFKGYVIPYKIDTDKKEITILGIKKYLKDF